MIVLVVEDDEMIADGLTFSLLGEGYEVKHFSNVKSTMEYIQGGGKMDFCLLDVMLPDGNGFTVCQEIRKTMQVPILFLTACNDEVSTVRALEIGADDYIAKPFRVRELLARMAAILRRTGGDKASDATVKQVGKNLVNMQTGKVYRDNEEVILTAMEYKLLLLLLNHRGQTLSRNQILNAIWDDVGEFVNDNTLTVYMKRLRKKLGDEEDSQLIETIRGMGYRMN